MNCPVCGYQGNPNEKFCMKCGYSFPLQQGQAMQYQGAPMQQGMPMNQGTPMQQGAPMNQGAPMQQGANNYQNFGMPPAQKKKNKGLVIALSVIIAVLLIGGGIAAYIFLSVPGYEKVVKTFCQAIEENDDDLYYEIEDSYFAEFRATYAKFAQVIGSNELADIFDNLFDEFVVYYAGDDIDPDDISKVEYEIMDIDENPDPDYLEDTISEKSGYSIKELKDLINLYGSELDSNTLAALDRIVDQIEGYAEVIEDADEAYRVDFKITVYGDKKDKNKKNTSIIVLKKDGEWTMIPNFGAIDF